MFLQFSYTHIRTPACFKTYTHMSTHACTCMHLHTYILKVKKHKIRYRMSKKLPEGNRNCNWWHQYPKTVSGIHVLNQYLVISKCLILILRHLIGIDRCMLYTINFTRKCQGYLLRDCSDEYSHQQLYTHFWFLTTLPALKYIFIF